MEPILTLVRRAAASAATVLVTGESGTGKELGGNITEAARRAGMERESLHRLLERYGVRSEDFKSRE